MRLLFWTFLICAVFIRIVSVWPVDKAKTTPSRSVFSDVRDRLGDFYSNALPQPHSLLVSGISWGIKPEREDTFWKALSATGTAHVVVASGMNVTMFGIFLLNFFLNFVKRRKAILGAMSGVWIYTLISGLEPPLIRAAIMATIGLGAQASGRISKTVRVLVLTFAVMVFIKPEWIDDLSFMLSFLFFMKAVAG